LTFSGKAGKEAISKVAKYFEDPAFRAKALEQARKGDYLEQNHSFSKQITGLRNSGEGTRGRLMVMDEQLVEFCVSGRLGGLHIGVSVAEVSELLGEPDGVTGPLPAVHLYGDVQLGFSADGTLWHLAVEPGGPQIVLPGGDVPSMTLKDFAAFAKEKGVAFEQCEPFTAGELWWRLPDSKTLLSFEDDGILSAAHRSEPALLND